jgi:hypothetical protein
MTFGPIDTIFTGGAALILIAGIYALLRLGFTDPQPAAGTAPASIADTPLALAASEDGVHPGEPGE